MSFKVLSILVVLVCVLTTAANPAAEGNVTETAAHGKKSEHGWKKKHAAAERRNTTQTHYHHATRKMKEEKEPAKETVKTKRNAIEDDVNFNYDKWLKYYKANLGAYRLHIAKELATLKRLEAVQDVDDLAEIEPLPAKEITTLVNLEFHYPDLESDVVQAVDPASHAVAVESAASASDEELAPLPAFGKDEPNIAVEDVDSDMQPKPFPLYQLDYFDKEKDEFDPYEDFIVEEVEDVRAEFEPVDNVE